MKLLIECTTNSQYGSERSNPQAEAHKGEPMSHNESELDTASLTESRVAKFSEMLKPVINCEETFVCNSWTLRSDWRWRVGKDKLRNLRDPFGHHVKRESDNLIVAKKRLINVEPRGLTVSVQSWRYHVSA